MKRVIIVHCWDGYPKKHWYSWLKKELEKKGFAVELPAMPETAEPTLKKWLPYLQKTIGEADEDTYLVGHSLGCITILHYLENLPKGKRIGGTVLVAGFSEPIGYDELKSFFAKKVDYKKVKRSANKFVLIHSDNDPYVPMERGTLMEAKLGAKLLVMRKAGHVTTQAGYKQLPQALKAVLEISK